MKKLSVLLSIVLVLMFGIFALGSGEDTVTNQGSGTADNQQTGAADNKETGAAETTETLSNIGKYNVEISSCRLAKDYEGKDVVIVKYIFTNVSDDEPAAFFLTFEDHVYQNGVGLNEAYVLDDSANYNSDNQTKEIKKGASLEVEVAYALNDSTTAIEVEVKELFSFQNTLITKTFSIA